MFDSRKSQLSTILGETNFPWWELLMRAKECHATQYKPPTYDLCTLVSSGVIRSVSCQRKPTHAERTINPYTTELLNFNDLRVPNVAGDWPNFWACITPKCPLSNEPFFVSLPNVGLLAVRRNLCRPEIGLQVVRS